VVHPRGDALLIGRTRRLYRIVRDVYAGRGLSRRQRSPGWYPGKALGLSPTVDYIVGPLPLKLLFQGCIVAVGFLMLAGAVNTALVVSNGVLNRARAAGRSQRRLAVSRGHSRPLA
jgi:hypothetical protein